LTLARAWTREGARRAARTGSGESAGSFAARRDATRRSLARGVLRARPGRTPWEGFPRSAPKSRRLSKIGW
jgi:hypothetical protein